MGTIVRLSSIVEVKKKVHVIEGDPSDNHVLAYATSPPTISQRAQAVVFGDGASEP
jgi:hypothetical protein